MTFKTESIQHQASPEQQTWVEQELAEQEQRYAAIEREMEALEPTRRKWYREFFDRLTSLGFNQDGDNKVRIAPKDLPAQPEGKKDQVVWKWGIDGE